MSRFDYKEFNKIWKELNNPNNRVAYISADKASSYPVAELKIFDGNTDNVIFTMEHHEKPYGFIKVNDRDGREIEKSYKHEKNLGFEACSVLFKYGFDIVVEQRKEQGDVLKKTETRAGLSQENSEALYAHYEELMKENLDEVVQAVAQGNPQKVFDLQQEGLHDTRFKDSEVLYTVALCEKVQKEYDSYDTESNVEAQRYPIPGSLKLLGEKVSRLSDEEKSLIPKSVWNRLGNVVINETLNDYYESPDRDGLIDRNTRRLNDGVKNLLPDVAKYGSYEDSRLLNATLIIARANDDESQLGEGQASERALKAAKGCRKRVKRDRAEAQKKQDIQKRIKYLKNKEKEVSGVVIADKIAEAQRSGVIYEPVTPERGNKMAENIRRKLSQKSR